MRVPRLHKETSLFGSLSIRAAIELLRNKIALVVEDGSSATSVTVTSGMIEAVARQLVIKGVDGTTTLIEGGKLITNRLVVGQSQVTNLVTDLANAAKTATNFLTVADSTGVMVHPGGVSNTGVKITDVVDILRAGVSVARYGLTSRVGLANKPHVETSDSGVAVYGADGSSPVVSMARDSSSDSSYIAFDGPQGEVGLYDAANTGSLFVKFVKSTCQAIICALPTALSNGASIIVDGANETISFVGSFNASNVNAGTFDAARIPNLPTSKLNSGTLALARGGTNSDNTATAINRVFAGPSSGNAGNASFRSLVAADIPNLSASKITTDKLAAARGGTGQSWVAMAAGTKVVTLSNGRWASVVSASDVADLLGSGASSSNTVAIVQNGDHGACDKVFTGSIGSDGSVRGYLSENHTGSVRFNYLLVRFA